MTNEAHLALEAMIDRLHGRGRLRVWSLIVTIFGDALAPRGGRVGLSVLQEVMGRLRVEPGAVRTALSRLAAEGWVIREKDGRNSIYRLADTGRAEIERATRRIYASGPPFWDGRWTVALQRPFETSPILLADSAKIMLAHGFAACGAGAWLRPALGGGDDGPDLSGFIVICGQADSEFHASALWALEPLAAAYRALIDEFAPLGTALAAGGTLDPLSALAARILVNHDWRRVALRDVALPAALLPADWPGEDARDAVRSLHGRLATVSEGWLDTAGLPPLVDPEAFAGRFGEACQSSR